MVGVTDGVHAPEPSGRGRHINARAPEASDKPRWVVLSDVVAAAAGLLATALIMATVQDRLEVDASVDLLGVVGTLVVVGGVALSFVIALDVGT